MTDDESAEVWALRISRRKQARMLGGRLEDGWQEVERGIAAASEALARARADAAGPRTLSMTHTALREAVWHCQRAEAAVAGLDATYRRVAEVYGSGSVARALLARWRASRRRGKAEGVTTDE